MAHLYDRLVELRDGVTHLALAKSVTPNKDATEWTITLTDGATFSDQRPVTAADVKYSLSLLADPAASPSYATFFQDLDLNATTVVDDHTLKVALKRPRGDFVTTVLAFASPVFPEGFTEWQKPISSGPYTLVSYVAGERIVLKARDDHYLGKPAIENLEISVIDDPQTRMNALKSGEIDFATRVDPVIAKAEESNPEVKIHRGGDGDSQTLGFEMNVKQPPFDNPKVREAMKLAINRQELVDTIFLGQGSVGNDLVGLGLEGYNDGVPQRKFDQDRARELFREAGVTEVTIRASEVTPGLTRAAELFAEQLAAVGVKAKVESVEPASFYADMDVLMSTPLQVTYYINRDAGAYLGSFSGSKGFFNISGYAPAEFDALLAKAQATVDDKEREEIFGRAQQKSWQEGGTILWGYQAVLNAGIPGLDGVYLSQGVPVFTGATIER
ncbi:ABC transporter substrate-binding protein [Enemella sp. A6]|uniref:ABC transporter substrate-binding protein n=1 Tax=Enemella sp. A6 TaxID=3440152 RepID=UPI003EBBC4C0